MEEREICDENTKIWSANNYWNKKLKKTYIILKKEKLLIETLKVSMLMIIVIVYFKGTYYVWKQNKRSIDIREEFVYELPSEELILRNTLIWNEFERFSITLGPCLSYVWMILTRTVLTALKTFFCCCRKQYSLKI